MPRPRNRPHVPKYIGQIVATALFLGCSGEVPPEPGDAAAEDLPEERAEDVAPTTDRVGEDRREAAADGTTGDGDVTTPVDVALDREAEDAPALDAAVDRAAVDAAADGVSGDPVADRMDDVAVDRAAMDAAADRVVDVAADRVVDVAVDRVDDVALDRAPGDVGAGDGGDGGDAASGDRPDVVEVSCPYFTSGGEAQFDVRSAPLTGRFTVNGVAPPPPPTRALVYLFAGGGYAQLGELSAGGYRTAAIPGTYDVIYRHEMGAAVIPRNTDARLRAGVEVPPAGGTLDVDVRPATVSGRFTINGSAVSGAALASIVLSDQSTRTTAPLASAVGDYSAPVMPGTYDLYYVWITDAEGAPRNQFRTIRRGVVVPPGGTTLNVDVPAVAVSGRITVNGAPPPAGSRARLTLKDATGAERVPLADVSAGTYRSLMMPGTYDLYYETNDNTPGLPRNPSVRLRAGVVIPAGGTTLDVDVPMAELSGRWTVNGAPATGLGTPVLTLRTPLGNVPANAYGSDVIRVSMVPGTYEVLYNGDSFAPRAPANGGAVLRSVDLRPGGTTINVDVPSAPATVRLSVNGAFPPGFAGTTLSLVDATGGSVAFEFSSTGPLTLPVIPGTYEARYDGATGFIGYPRNPRATIRTVVVPPGGGTFNFDVPAVSFTWRLSLNGAPWPATGNNAELCLSDGAYCVPIGRAADLPTPVALIPGVYDLYYRFVEGTLAPKNTFARLQCLWVR